MLKKHVCNHRFLSMMISVSVLCVMLFALLAGCTLKKPVTKDLSMYLYGTWVTLEGSALGTTEFSLTVTPKDSGSKHLSFTFADNFPYLIDDASHTPVQHPTDPFPYDVMGSYTYSKPANEPVFVQFALSQEEGLMIFQWADQPDRFLVASVKQGTAPADILRHFTRFCTEHCA